MTGCIPIQILRLLLRTCVDPIESGSHIEKWQAAKGLSPREVSGGSSTAQILLEHSHLVRIPHPNRGCAFNSWLVTCRELIVANFGSRRKYAE
jgi:hypothetical protein